MRRWAWRGSRRWIDAHAGLRCALLVAGHDVEPGAEVVTARREHDDAHGFVAAGPSRSSVIHRRDHLVVQRVANLGPVQHEVQHAVVDADVEPGDACRSHSCVGHGRGSYGAAAAEGALARIGPRR